MQYTKNKDDTEIDEVGGMVWGLRDLQGKTHSQTRAREREGK